MDTKKLIADVLTVGPESLEDDELYALFAPGKDCPPTESIRFIPGSQLVKRWRLSRLEAARLKACLELGRRMAARSPEVYHIANAFDAVKAASRLPFRTDRECFGVLTLDARHNCIASEIVTVGTLSSSLVHSREMYRTAIRNSGYAVIMVHNHPSGDATPSAIDLEVTEGMKKAGEILGIKLLDHVILAGDTFYSFSEKKISNIEEWIAD